MIEGGPGTGKSTLIVRLVRALEEDGKSVGVTAATGIAAQNLREKSLKGTRTVHQFTGKQICCFLLGTCCVIYNNSIVWIDELNSLIGINDGRLPTKLLEHILPGDEAFEEAAKRINNIDVLILDEGSMISQYTFEQVFKLYTYYRIIKLEW